MRIIAGTWRGQRISAPLGSQTRPTSDRVREACFSSLGQPESDVRVLDLFAGSGAMGLEALSRGAKHTTFVESSHSTLKTLDSNINALNAKMNTRVYKGDAIRFLQATKADSFDWIFIDPPYKSTLANEALELIANQQILATSGTIVVEHDKRILPNDFSPSLIQAKPRRYGDTSLTFYRSPN